MTKRLKPIWGSFSS